jgi:hypothetical protein
VFLQQHIHLKQICQLAGITTVFFTGCGLLGSGGEEETQSQPGHAVYRAKGEVQSEFRSSEKVPGETR